MLLGFWRNQEVDACYALCNASPCSLYTYECASGSKFGFAQFEKKLFVAVKCDFFTQFFRKAHFKAMIIINHKCRDKLKKITRIHFSCAAVHLCEPNALPRIKTPFTFHIWIEFNETKEFFFPIGFWVTFVFHDVQLLYYLLSVTKKRIIDIWMNLLAPHFFPFLFSFFLLLVHPLTCNRSIKWTNWNGKIPVLHRHSRLPILFYFFVSIKHFERINHFIIWMICYRMDITYRSDWKSVIVSIL